MHARNSRRVVWHTYQEFFLQVGHAQDVLSSLLELDGRVASDDTKTRARGIEQNAVEATH
jgi:hypothetical protein